MIRQESSMVEQHDTSSVYPPLRVFISAGEPSGDRQAAALVAALRRSRPDMEIRAIGGQQLAQAGAQILMDNRRGAVMGIGASLARVPLLVPQILRVAKKLKADRPDVAILVDWGGANVRLARLLRPLQIPMLYYFPPRSWDRRARPDIASLVDAIATPFPWSKHILSGRRARVEWVGHPLVDQVSTTVSKAEALQKLGLVANQPVAALLPGSRKSEIQHCLPVLIETAQKLAKQVPGIQFLISAPPEVRRLHPHLEALLETKGITARILDGMDYDALQCADVAVAVSGTVTLELALLGVPLVVIYRGSLGLWLQYEIFSHTIAPVRFFSILNLIADRQIVPELMQWQANPEQIGKEVMSLLSDKTRAAKMQDELAAACRQLGPPGAVERTAEMVLDLVAYGPQLHSDSLETEIIPDEAEKSV
jgi:lipid-A-disaccharide synthase